PQPRGHPVGAAVLLRLAPRVRGGLPAGVARRARRRGRDPTGLGLMGLQATDPLRVWLAGLEVGLRSVAREPVLGLKRIILPVSYWRSREYAYVWRQLSSPAGARILDLGSPKSLAHMLARHRG